MTRLFSSRVASPRELAHSYLDEVPSVPAVFAVLRGMTDRDRRRNGRFILLGSAQPTLMQLPRSSVSAVV